MKFYDKDLTQKSEAMSSTILILLIFIIGFATGYFSIQYEYKTNFENDINQLQDIETNNYK